MKTPTIMRAALLGAFVQLMAGCVHLHNEGNAELAQAANTNFDAIISNAHAQFQQEADNQDKSLQEEIEGVARFTNRDEKARIALFATSDQSLDGIWIDQYFLPRLYAIGLPVGDHQTPKRRTCKRRFRQCMMPLEDIAQLMIDEEAEWDRFETRVSALQDTGYRGMVSCTFADGISKVDDAKIEKAIKTGADRSEIEEYFEEAREICDDWKKHSKAIRDIIASNEGDAKKAIDQFEIARDEMAAASRRVDEIKKEFSAARKALKDATVTAPDQKPSETIAARIETISEFVDGLDGLLPAVSESVKIEEQIKAINCVLEAATTNEGDDSQNSEGVIVEGAPDGEDSESCLTNSGRRISLVLAGAPEIVDEFGELGRLLDQPPLTALIMAKNELQARQRAANAAVARERARIRIAEERYRQLLDEIMHYNEAIQLLNDARRDFKNANVANLADADLVRFNLHDLMIIPAKNAQNHFLLNRARKGIIAAVALQTYAETSGLKRRYEAEYRTIAVDYDSTTAIQRARADQWLAMLKPLIQQQKTFHDSGIKTQEIASLAIEVAKAFGLIAIAAD